MADDDSSELSSLSSLSPVPSDVESDAAPEPESKKPGIMKFFPKLGKGKKPSIITKPKEQSPPPRKRSPSPPHEDAFEDNSDIAFLVMFRSRFNDAFPKSLANFGPQELERDVIETPPGDRVEAFLCALLFLLLNRKQDVKAGQYSKALDDALAAHKTQWPRSWKGVNPLSGNNTFHTIAPTQRLSLLRALALWSLSASETVKTIINKSYKSNRQEDDLNQPLSVQPWGSDSDRRRYYLIEGLDDTAFRVYRESNPAGFNRTWWSVAGSIDEIKALAGKLETKDGGPNARKLASKMMAAIPRFEATEEKRRRREYRQAQKARFKRPEPGFSVYEGRTRGKRIKYTYTDDEDDFLTDSSNRRSARNTGTHTPAEPAGPVTTASGRQIRAPPGVNGSSAAGSINGDSEDSRQQSEPASRPGGRPRRAAAVNHGTSGWTSKGRHSRGRDSMDDDDEDDASEPDLGDDDEEDHVPDESDDDENEMDEDVEMLDDDELADEPKKSLIVKLSVKKSPESAKTALITPASEDDEADPENEIVARPKETTSEPVINVATKKKQLSPMAVQTPLA